MKGLKLFLSFILFGFVLISCHSALKVTEVAPIETKQYQKPNMEFIGFKNTNRNKVLLKNFGAELERRNIALNKQDFYMGIYSFQELETYKPTMRYVSFIDISNLYDSWDDSIYDSDGLEFGGWFVAGLTCFTLFPVYWPMLAAADKNYCKLDLVCTCTLHV